VFAVAGGDIADELLGGEVNIVVNELDLLRLMTSGVDG
jgi:hypothetical protein